MQKCFNTRNRLCKFKLNHALYILPLVIALTVTGCKTAYEEQNNAALEFNQRRNAIYNAYLVADIDHARQDLLDLAELGETEQYLSPEAQASHLSQAYGWLFVFEERTGNKQLAGVYFEKAKYWRIREAELSGETDSKIGAHLGTLTKENVIADVDKWDKGASGGKGPHYLQQLDSKEK